MRRWMIGSAAGLAAVVLVGVALMGTAGGAGGNAAALSDRTLFATLTGQAESGRGDPDAKGSAAVLVTSTQVCATFVIRGIDRPTAAHIHQGRAGTNGSIVVPLTARAAGSGMATGFKCVNVTATLRNAIKRSSGGFYVNVHNLAFPNGAVRGQLTP